MVLNPATGSLGKEGSLGTDQELRDSADGDRDGVAGSPGMPGAPRSRARRAGPPLGPLEGVGPCDTLLSDLGPQGCRKAHLGGLSAPPAPKPRVCVSVDSGERWVWASRDLCLPMTPSGGLPCDGAVVPMPGSGIN